MTLRIAEPFPIAVRSEPGVITVIKFDVSTKFKPTEFSVYYGRNNFILVRISIDGIEQLAIPEIPFELIATPAPKLLLSTLERRLTIEVKNVDSRIRTLIGALHGIEEE